MTTLSRRVFLASTAAAAGLAPHPFSLSSQGREGRGEGAADKPRRKYKYIDIHTHLGTFYWGKELTVDGLLPNDLEDVRINPESVVPVGLLPAVVAEGQGRERDERHRLE